MNIEQLHQQIERSNNYLCVGLDPDVKKLPPHLLKEKDAWYIFLSEIIEQTLPYCVAYKPNTAFFENLGDYGWNLLSRIRALIPDSHYCIADAKRGDIGNTSFQYANHFLNTLGFDAITLSPYMGRDSIEPFWEFQDKAAVILALTSNEGSNDFQRLTFEGKPLWEHVITACTSWSKGRDIMFVCGATHPNDFIKIREVCPNQFLLIPGIGAQGGDLNTEQSGR